MIGLFDIVLICLTTTTSTSLTSMPWCGIDSRTSNLDDLDHSLQWPRLTSPFPFRGVHRDTPPSYTQHFACHLLFHPIYTPIPSVFVFLSFSFFFWFLVSILVFTARNTGYRLAPAWRLMKACTLLPFLYYDWPAAKNDMRDDTNSELDFALNTALVTSTFFLIHTHSCECMNVLSFLYIGSLGLMVFFVWSDFGIRVWRDFDFDAFLWGQGESVAI